MPSFCFKLLFLFLLATTCCIENFSASAQSSCVDTPDDQKWVATIPGVDGWPRSKSCKWVRRASTSWRCFNVIGAKENCPKTCTNCCEDNAGSFSLTYNGEVKTCAWVANLNTDKRCGKIPARTECPLTCGQCTQAPSPAPSPAPSTAPSAAPSLVPSPAPSAAPTQALTDRQILGELYASTNGNNWLNSDGWNNDGVSVCDWYGVKCNVNDMGIAEINLSSNQLKGTIPTELGQLTTLTSLTTLELYNNQLTGTIPTELGRLFSLKQRLGLSTNQLTGTIPTELMRLSDLYALDFYINQLTGTIPKQIRHLSTLSYINLSQNQLTGTIPKKLGMVSTLRQIYFNDNQLAGSIPTELGQLTNLELLHLYDNQSIWGSVPTEVCLIDTLIENLAISIKIDFCGSYMDCCA